MSSMIHFIISMHCALNANASVSVHCPTKRRVELFSRNIVYNKSDFVEWKGVNLFFLYYLLPTYILLLFLH